MEWDVVTRRFALALCAAASLALAGAPARAQTKWNLPAAYPPDNYHSENLNWFAKEVEKATGGRLIITVHAGASLFKAPEIKRAVATGQTQIGELLISIHENEDPVFGLDAIPFLVSSYADAKKLWQAQKPVIAKKLDSQGMMLFYAVPWGPQGLYANKDINTVEDMKGLKMRAYNVATTRIAELVGAQPVTVQAAELAQALATGTANAFMTSGSTGFDIKVWETISHFYDVQAWIPKNIVLVNKAAFAALDGDRRDALLKAAEAAEERGWKIAPEKAQWYVEQLKAKGMKVQPPGPQLRDGLAKIGEQLTEDWLRRAGADGKAVLDAYRTSR